MITLDDIATEALRWIANAPGGLSEAAIHSEVRSTYGVAGRPVTQLLRDRGLVELRDGRLCKVLP